MNNTYQVLITLCIFFFSIFVSSCIKQSEEGAVGEPEKKAENPAPGIKAESDTSTSVGKTDGENALPVSKVVSLLLHFLK